MTQIDALVKKLEKTGEEIFWHGKTSAESIEQLEGLLNVRLPKSFRQFITVYGGGGLVGEEISGIEDDDATLDNRGTILGDTYQCRTQFSLPSHLIVIYFGADDVVWCLDISFPAGTDCPVVSFDVNSRVTKQLAESFEQFFERYVASRIDRT